MFCIKCGKKLADSGNYCEYCGTKKIGVQKETESPKIIYEEEKELPPSPKASQTTILGVIVLTMVISILLIVFTANMIN